MSALCLYVCGLMVTIFSLPPRTPLTKNLKPPLNRTSALAPFRNINLNYNSQTKAIDFIISKKNNYDDI